MPDGKEFLTMDALAQVAVTQRGIEALHRQSGAAESPFDGAGYRNEAKSRFSAIESSSSSMANHNTSMLTHRECAILQLLGNGLSNKEAARNLGISPETVKSHVKNIFQKLCVYRRAQAVSLALRLGVITSG